MSKNHFGIGGAITAIIIGIIALIFIVAIIVFLIGLLVPPLYRDNYFGNRCWRRMVDIPQNKESLASA